MIRRSPSAWTVCPFVFGWPLKKGYQKRRSLLPVAVYKHAFNHYYLWHELRNVAFTFFLPITLTPDNFWWIFSFILGGKLVGWYWAGPCVWGMLSMHFEGFQQVMCLGSLSCFSRDTIFSPSKSLATSHSLSMRRWSALSCKLMWFLWLISLRWPLMWDYF